MDLAKAEDLDKAVALSGTEFEGQQIVVEEARAKKDTPSKTPDQQKDRPQRDSESMYGAVLLLVKYCFKH